jgi:hypothetical protein
LVGQAVGLALIVIACLIGLRWGLEGVAWGCVATQVYFAIYLYVLVHRTISTRVAHLFIAAKPALMLNALLFAILAIAHLLLTPTKADLPWAYVLTMAFTGFVTYTCAFLFLPIPALKGEADRWRQQLVAGFRSVRKPPH